MNTISAAAEAGFDIGSTIKAIQAPDSFEAFIVTGKQIGRAHV